MNNDKETSEQFVTRMLTGLTPKTLPNYPHSTFYVDSNDNLIIEIEYDIAWCRNTDFWEVLESEFNFEYNAIQALVKPILEQTLKVEGITPFPLIFRQPQPLEQTLKVKGVTLWK